MPATHPTAGTYRLTPDEQYDMPPYEVIVSPQDECERFPLSPYPWSESTGDFRRSGSTGWQFGYRCYGGSYLHFALNPNPGPEGPIITLDTGLCEAV